MDADEMQCDLSDDSGDIPSPPYEPLQSSAMRVRRVLFPDVRGNNERNANTNEVDEQEHDEEENDESNGNGTGKQEDKKNDNRDRVEQEHDEEENDESNGNGAGEQEDKTNDNRDRVEQDHDGEENDDSNGNGTGEQEDKKNDSRDRIEQADGQQENESNANELEQEAREIEADRQKRSSTNKKNACLYCGHLYVKITPHLEAMHAQENDVKAFGPLPKGCPERKNIIEKIRREGNFKHNASQEKSQSKNIILCRRPQRNKPRDVEMHYKPCPTCKGFISILSLRKHYKQCCKKQTEKSTRNVMTQSRMIYMKTNAKACDTLKTKILPVLRDDDISKFAKNDGLIVTYGNRMCEKYRDQHHHPMIRSRLRVCGRFLKIIKGYESEIEQLADAFSPKHYDAVIKTINEIGGLDNTGKYKAPSTAFNLGIQLKYICNLLIAECIKEQDFETERNVQHFVKLLNDGLPNSINKTVFESQTEMRRRKVIQLPTKEDIQLLNEFLKTKRRSAHRQLEQKFDVALWKELASLTLISIQLFNRRRAGEIERIFINDFKKLQTINEEVDGEIFASLSSEGKKATQLFSRCEIRGKLGRDVAVILHNELVVYINFILSHREEVGVPQTNPYIFGIPSTDGRDKHLEACKLLREYSTACGASSLSSLRGTELRKHIATQSVLLNLQENEIHDLANFLGHSDKIHKNHYRIPIASREIVIMSSLLRKAQGEGTDEEDDDGADIGSSSIAGIQRSIPKTRPSLTRLPPGTQQSPLRHSVADIQGFPRVKTQQSSVRTSTPKKQSSPIAKTQRSQISSRQSSPSTSSNWTVTRVRNSRQAGVDNMKTCVVRLTPMKEEEIRSPRKKRRVVEIAERNPKIDFSEYDESDDPFATDCSDDESVHYNSEINESDDSYTDVEVNKGFKPKLHWSTPERKAARKYLVKYTTRNPSLAECAATIKKEPELRTRTALQLKTWITNTKKREKRKLQQPGMRARWTTPQKTLVRKVFAEHLKAKRYPSMEEYRNIIKTNPVLENRTVQALRSFIQHSLKKGVQ